jgi:hypothetical protein
MNVISRREQLAIVLAAERAPGDRVAAIGAAQLQEHHMRQTDNAQQAARDARWVAIGMTTMSVKNGLQPRLFARAVAEIACEILIVTKKITVMEAADWIDIVEKRAECLTHPDYIAAHVVARAALHQHIIDMCPTCQGKKEIPDHDIPDLNGVQPMKMCGDCNGTGKRKYSDDECGDALKGFVGRKHAREQINDALEIIQRCEVTAIRHWARVLR